MDFNGLNRCFFVGPIRLIGHIRPIRLIGRQLVDLLTRRLVDLLTCWLAMWLFRHEGVFEAEEVEHAVDADGGDALLGCFLHLWLSAERDAQTSGF